MPTVQLDVDGNSRLPYPHQPMSEPSDQRFGLNRSVTFPADVPFRLDNGADLTPLTIAYETYGTLNAAKSNAILIFHALTGDQHVASVHPVTGKEGWWTRVVGPGGVIDTDKYLVICANVLGGCLGSTGPRDINPVTDAPWAMTFPVITIRDMVRAQAQLLDYLEISTLLCVVGGSMGGMLALEWAADYAHRTRSAMVIASTARHSAQNIAFHEVGRQAIMADPLWRSGTYYGETDGPSAGLAVARMAAHITYLSEDGLTEKFGRRLQNRDALSFGFDADFQVESYLRHQGIRFVERFDANSYLYITRAMDYFDVAGTRNQKLADIYRHSPTRFCVISFTSDWLYPTTESRHIVRALTAAGARVSYVDLETSLGHDSFLLDVPEMWTTMRGFLGAVAQEVGL
jgi:homoserine O-acetyltransferase/O-succinyltransferase